MTTNEFERNLDDQAGLKRPGRIDMRVFQNTADAGDGHPGVQRCFRNYLHEGGMEKDIDLVGFGIKGTSVDITNVKLQQLSNIGSSVITIGIWSQLSNISDVEISSAQWGYLGAMNQGVTTTSNVAFGQITMSGDVIMGSNNITLSASQTVDTVDVSAHDHSTGDKGVNVPFTSLSGSIVYSQVSAIVDISGVGTADHISSALHEHTDSDGSSKIAHVNTTGRTANDHHNQSHVLSGGDHSASGLTIGNVIRASGSTTFVWAQLGHGDLSTIGNNAHSVIDTHLASTSNPHSTSLDGLSDVVITSIADNDLIAWNNGTSKYINQNASEAGLATSGHLHDGQTLQHNGVDNSSGDFNLRTGTYINLKSNYKTNEYIQFFTTAAGITCMGGVGSEDIYFQVFGTSNWNTVHADEFTPHSAPMPTELSTDKILAIKNVEDDSCIDYDSIPFDTLYQEPDGKNKGYKMNKMILHLIKTVQELNTRLEELEDKG